MANQPEKKFRAKGLCATIWMNDGKDGKPYATVNIERSYKDLQDNWKTTTTLRVNDLPTAQMLLQKCYEHVTLKGEE